MPHYGALRLPRSRSTAGRAAGHQLVRWLIYGVRLRRWLVYQRDTNEMEILKRLLRDYLVASCPAISQNIYMYPRAGEVIETAGQLSTKSISD